MDGSMQAGGFMTETFEPSADPRAFRDALGQFGTGVTVITCECEHGPLGITANSFASVSLDPALVLWSPGKFSKRYPAFCTATHYAIHVLAEDQLRMGGAFAKNGLDFSVADWERSPEGIPVLKGCLARFECRKVAEHDGGDHAIIVGEVLRATTAPGTPLIFAQGQYGGFTQLS